MCTTLLLLSCAHIVFYMPLSMFRVAYLLVPTSTWNVLGPEARLQLLGIGMELYSIVAPVHVANFVIYVWRVPGFAARLVYLFVMLWRKFSWRFKDYIKELIYCTRIYSYVVQWNLLDCNLFTLYTCLHNTHFKQKAVFAVAPLYIAHEHTSVNCTLFSFLWTEGVQSTQVSLYKIWRVHLRVNMCCKILLTWF